MGVAAAPAPARPRASIRPRLPVWRRRPMARLVESPRRAVGASADADGAGPCQRLAAEGRHQLDTRRHRRPPTRRVRCGKRSLPSTWAPAADRTPGLRPFPLRPRRPGGVAQCRTFGVTAVRDASRFLTMRVLSDAADDCHHELRRHSASRRAWTAEQRQRVPVRLLRRVPSCRRGRAHSGACAATCAEHRCGAGWC